MAWLLILLVLAAVAFWAIGTLRSGPERAPNILNKDGWPGSVTRDKHGRNDEE